MIASSRKGSTEVILAALKDKNANVVAAAIYATAQLGPSVASKLIASLKGADIDTQVAIVKAVDQIKWRARKPEIQKRTARALTKLLDENQNSQHSTLIVETIKSIGQLGRYGNSASDHMCRYLEYSNPDIRAASAAALGKIETSQQIVISRLNQIAASDPTEYVRAAARGAVKRIGKNAIVQGNY